MKRRNMSLCIFFLTLGGTAINIHFEMYALATIDAGFCLLNLALFTSSLIGAKEHT